MKKTLKTKNCVKEENNQVSQQGKFYNFDIKSLTVRCKEDLKNFKTFIEYINVELKEFQILQGLLKKTKGQQRKQKTLSEVKRKSQTYGPLYDEIKKEVSNPYLKVVKNQIFHLRTVLWKDTIISVDKKKLFLDNNLNSIQSTGKLYDGVIILLENFKITIEVSIKMILLIQKILIGDQVDKCELKQQLINLSKTLSEKGNATYQSRCNLENCVYQRVTIRDEIIHTYSTIKHVFDDFNKLLINVYSVLKINIAKRF